MKHLMTLVALLVSTAAVAQIPMLPWNPDENGDHFIGLPDLLGLLTVYGQEFENAIVSEDGESAIMYMGNMGLLQCDYACQNLPGFWNMPSPPELTPVLNVDNAWIAIDWSQEPLMSGTYGYLYPFFDNGKIRATPFIDSENVSCYCTAKQLPRVEYFRCNAQIPGGFVQCCNNKVAEGWYPLGGIALDQIGGSIESQAFWRFAQ
ncbi:hypothetical protein N9V29_02540 [Flavobacteriales bacterium]|nr:hypothetical protein [Flavobacteriales bacterium]